MGKIEDSFRSALDTAAVAAKERTEPCSRFAEKNRTMGQPYPGPLTHRYHPWTREIRDCQARMMVAQKCAQSGYTEAGLDRAFWDLVVNLRDVLYVLPDDGAASDFSSGRVNPAIEMSRRLSEHFTDCNNVGHKRAGAVNLYIRGAKSRTGLKSVPVANLVLDELNEMPENNVELVFERVSGQPEEIVRIAMFSTPTIPDFGISEFIKSSSRAEFYITCPNCKKRIPLHWPRNFCLDRVAVVCHLCDKVIPFDRETKVAMLATGEWVHEFPELRKRGAGYYNLNQLYSCSVSPQTIKEAWNKAQIKVAAEQEFFNSKMGLPHVAAGAKLSVTDVRNCHTDDPMVTSAPISTIGVDVGKWYYWAASEWAKIDANGRDDEPLNWRRRLLCAGKCLSTEELAEVFYRFNPRRIVVDAQPETREVRRLAKVFKVLWLCWIKEISDTMRVREPLRSLDINRTEWLDLLFDRVRRGKGHFLIPRTVGKEFEDHLTVPTRVYVRDRKGNVLARYQSPGEDHYAFAATLDEVAHHIQFIGRQVLTVSEKQVEDAREERKRPLAKRDVKRYTEEVLEKLTGSRRIK